MDISKFLDWIKLSPRHLAALAIASGFLLFARDKWLETIGLSEFAPKYKAYIGIIFLLACALLASQILSWLYLRVSERRKWARKIKNATKHLNSLTEEEKGMLRGYIESSSRTQYLPIGSGVVRGLEWDMILIQASDIGDLEDWPYNIQPWAWDYLHKHPEILNSLS